MNPKIKICCIKTIEEAKIAIKYGANAIGLVSEMPSGPGIISESKILEITNSIPHEIDTFLLTSKTSLNEIKEQHDRIKTKTIQLVDYLDEVELSLIKSIFPRIKIIQVVHVVDHSSIQDAIRFSSYVDGILLDSGNPHESIKILGGTGKTHNWEISKRIVESIDIPVYLAGGLHSKNIIEALEIVQPFGIDVCSGVRTNGQLDERKLAAFCTNARQC